VFCYRSGLFTENESSEIESHECIRCQRVNKSAAPIRRRQGSSIGSTVAANIPNGIWPAMRD
jgi:hypothetical protein